VSSSGLSRAKKQRRGALPPPTHRLHRRLQAVEEAVGVTGSRTFICERSEDGTYEYWTFVDYGRKPATREDIRDGDLLIELKIP